MTVLTRTIDRGLPSDVAWVDQGRLAEAERSSRSSAWDWDIITGSLWWSDEVFRIFGLKPQEFAATYEGFLERVHPDDRDELTRMLELALQGVERYDLRHRVIRPDGTMRYVREQGMIVRTTDGTPKRMLGTVLDITESTVLSLERASAHDKLVASERKYRVLAENASDVILQMGTQGSVIWASDSVGSVLGWSPEQILAGTMTQFVHPDDQDRAMSRTQDAVSDRLATGEFRVKCADDSYRWMQAGIHIASDRAGTSQVVALRDIQDEVDTRDRLAYAIDHDLLTGLASRQVAVAYLDRLLSLPGQSEVGVICVGIDSLRAVNEALTHSGGDYVIATVGARIGAFITEPSLQYRHRHRSRRSQRRRPAARRFVGDASRQAGGVATATSSPRSSCQRKRNAVWSSRRAFATDCAAANSCRGSSRS